MHRLPKDATKENLSSLLEVGPFTSPSFSSNTAFFFHLPLSLFFFLFILVTGLTYSLTMQVSGCVDTLAAIVATSMPPAVDEWNAILAMEKVQALPQLN
jgi:hypothetical protein